ncbi:alpha/beta fold hydrolase [Clostridium estertheticum]|uniref:alpha/beta fold hydrolase n=1 Tax=Clostridium estertheticum TaxID=238834 RepID=UPI001CF28362|nr:alpha/beta hydrolase [Clostridium estertheticum]MCB2353493.1 alpha/beta hydrolase [Clostridium estertheticum]WAG41833.1 alpha/beta hydrolase [Clostridium estertheticum]
MKHKSVKSERGITHYWINEIENARCIVFTHGLTANHMMFEKQVEYFSTKYTVITWDVPLHGESRPYTNFSYENTAIELKTILDVENIQQVILVGMSMGGYPSQEFAIQYPNKVIAFIALDTTPLGQSYYSALDRWWLKQVEHMAKWFTDKTLRNSMAKSVSKTQYAYDMMIKMLEPLSKADIVEQMGIAYGRVFDRKESVHFNFPVLILVGEYDKTGKVKHYCEAWSEKEGYPLHIIKGASHFSNGDNYDDVNKEIDNFICGL